jgi:hypothetical protein
VTSSASCASAAASFLGPHCPCCSSFVASAQQANTLFHYPGTAHVAPGGQHPGQTALCYQCAGILCSRVFWGPLLLLLLIKLRFTQQTSGLPALETYFAVSGEGRLQFMSVSRLYR